jgi:2-iminobutanoate/2-iminopropanoate deaminase
MKPKQSIASQHTPKAIGPYSQAIRSGDLVFTSGQLGLDPVTGELVAGGTAAQTRRALQNCILLLEAAGGSAASVLKVTVFLRSLDDFQEMKSAYAEFFIQNPPARTTVQAGALLKGAAVEIDCIARIPSPAKTASRRK